MPGLVGIISRQHPEICHQQIRAMHASMQYEDFFSAGTYSYPEMSAYVGWTCQPKSFCDCLPITNQLKDVVLFFSGEVFWDQEYISLYENGDGIGKARHLLGLYEEIGENFVEKLNGLFVGLLLDTRCNKVFLFTDRYGMHRIFVREGKDGLYFSSEAKALLAVLPETRGFDPRGVGEYLTCGCTLGSHSLYNNIKVLPPASIWSFEHGEAVKRETYFNAGEWSGQRLLDAKELFPILIDSFGDIVKRYEGGVQPLGVSLTGGLDSRMLMACLNKSSGELPCYTFGSIYRDTFDVLTAREIAKSCGQPHHTLVLGDEFLRDFPDFLEKAVYISDGYLGMSGAAELYVNSLARKLAPVRLTGNYGGELLRGHRAFKFLLPHGNFLRMELQPYIREARTFFKELEATDAVTFALFHQAPSQNYGRRTIEGSQVTLRSPYMDNDLVKLVYQAPPRMLKGDDLCVGIISRYKPSLLKIPTDRGLLCNSLALRSLSRQFHRKALIKAEYWSSHGMPNWLALITRHDVGQFLEKWFLGRDKFQHFQLWIQKSFSAYITDVLLQEGDGLEEFFDRGAIESMVDDHVAGRQNYTQEIDKILTLSLGSRLLLKSAPLSLDDKQGFSAST